MTGGRCCGCIYWKPLFTGEAWGVRSFVDAPEEAKAEIKRKLEAQMLEDEDADPYKALGYDQRGLSAGFQWWSREVPGGVDWPEWGECLLTILHSEQAERSLARAVDGSLYRAVLRCHAEFGCVQYQEFPGGPS